MTVEDIINPRQQAIVIWGCIAFLGALAFLLHDKSGRTNLRNILAAVVDPKIAGPIFSVLVWNGLAVWLLHWLGYWDITMLADTVALVAFGSIGLLFKASGATFNLGFFAKMVLFTLGLSVLIELLVNMYTFILPVEMVVASVATLIALMRVVADGTKEHQPIRKPLWFLEVALGGGLVLHSVVLAALDFRHFASFDTLRALFLPFVMTVLFLPPYYLFCTCMAYSSVFVPLALGSDKSWWLQRYARWKIFWRFGLNLGRLQAFDHTPSQNELRWVTSKDDLARVLRSSTTRMRPGG